MLLLYVPMQKSTAEMFRRCGSVLSQEQGVRYDPGSDVPDFQTTLIEVEGPDGILQPLLECPSFSW